VPRTRRHRGLGRDAMSAVLLWNLEVGGVGGLAPSSPVSISMEAPLLGERKVTFPSMYYLYLARGLISTGTKEQELDERHQGAGEARRKESAPRPRRIVREDDVFCASGVLWKAKGVCDAEMKTKCKISRVLGLVSPSKQTPAPWFGILISTCTTVRGRRDAVAANRKEL
jgi:hypothetical protein